jgi:colanic acid/amylovoran biosynthesis glycosyltransferase
VRVAFFVPSFPELSESFILRQVTGLLDHGVDVRVFAERRADGPTHPQVHEYALLDRTRFLTEPARLRHGVASHGQVPPVARLGPAAATALALTPSPTLRRRVAALRRVTWLRSEAPADVVHCHYGETGLLYGFAATLWRAPLVVSFYGYDCSSYVRAHGADVYRPLLRRASTVTVLGERMQRRLIELGAQPAQLEIQPLSVDTRAFTPVPRVARGMPRMLTVARLAEKKGIEYGIRAHALLVGRIPGLTYDIIGDGPLRGDLERIAQDAGVDGSVRFRGAMAGPDIATAMTEADVFVLPSTTAADGDEEGTPTVLLEAAACGLPVVSTRHADIPGIVEHDVTGLLVEERNVEDLAAAIASLLADEARRNAMGRDARNQAVDRYDVRPVTARLHALYASLLAPDAAAALRTGGS